MNRRTINSFCQRVILAVAACLSLSSPAVGQSEAKSNYRGVIGASSPKIKKIGDQTMIFAGRRGTSPGDPAAPWYDFTGSVIPPGDLQFGIGKDTIRSIDDPMFVSPDDPRLLKLRHSPYRSTERPKTNNEIPVIGYASNGEARAYPVALLDGHELVNDRVGGKPVTVGW